MSHLIRGVLLFFFLINSVFGFSQIFQPVHWEFNSTHIEGDEYELIIRAKIDDGWAVYSQYLERDDGPIATTFDFDKGDHFELIGKVEEDETNRKEGIDPIFEMNLVKYYHEGIFRQRVAVKDLSKEITGYLNYMTCDDVRCLPPQDVDFKFQLSAPESTEAAEPVEPEQKKVEAKNMESTKARETVKVEKKKIEAKQKFKAVPATKERLKKAKELEKENIDKERSENEGDVNPKFTVTELDEKLYGLSAIDLDNTVSDCETGSLAPKKNKSIWGIFILGILGGMLALLTPCVFPMIPLTVSFFTKSHSTTNKRKGLRDATLYGLFILLVYVALSIPFHLLDSLNPDILNEISTNVWLNIAFFLIFLFFAFSFFGYYELTLPESWTSRASSAEGIGGLLGIFFMALTLALVSFSCTGPILGSLLAGAMSSQGGAWQLTAGMTGFGLALALPFALFAMFPGWMNKLPKSGGWLNSVKVVLGFLELALALKFLSNADLVKHWGLLKIEPFLLLWIVIFVAMGIYLFGKLRFPHDSPVKKLSFTRIGLGTLSIAFAIYLASGFLYDKDKESFRPLKLLSGLAPPVGYSWIYPKDCPNNLNCFKDFSQGLAYAKEQNKPIMIDFTGYACVNCRKMEEHVWPNKQIYKMLDKEYVLISLYVDDKKELPEGEQIEVERIQGGKRKLRNYGHKWAHMQTKYFATNSQPHYVLMSSDGKQLLNKPVGYTPDVEDYANFLKCGLEAHKQLTGK